MDTHLDSINDIKESLNSLKNLKKDREKYIGLSQTDLKIIYKEGSIVVVDKKFNEIPELRRFLYLAILDIQKQVISSALLKEIEEYEKIKLRVENEMKKYLNTKY